MAYRKKLRNSARGGSLILGRRHADQVSEAAPEMALIGKAEPVRDLRDAGALAQQRLRAIQTQRQLKAVRRHAERRGEEAHQMAFARTGDLGEPVELDLLVVVLPEVHQRALDAR